MAEEADSKKALEELEGAAPAAAGEGEGEGADAPPPDAPTSRKTSTGSGDILLSQIKVIVKHHEESEDGECESEAEAEKKPKKKGKKKKKKAAATPAVNPAEILTKTLAQAMRLINEQKEKERQKLKKEEIRRLALQQKERKEGMGNPRVILHIWTHNPILPHEFKYRYTSQNQRDKKVVVMIWNQQERKIMCFFADKGLRGGGLLRLLGSGQTCYISGYTIHTHTTLTHPATYNMVDNN